jgi:cytochrome c553
MKRILTALTLSIALASPAWAFDSATILEKGKLVFHRESRLQW